MRPIRVLPTVPSSTQIYDYDHHKVASYSYVTSNTADSTFNSVNIARSHSHYTASQPSLESSCATMTISDSNNYAMRYYSTDLGRWINRDPVEEKIKLKKRQNVYDPKNNFSNIELNLYVFVSNSPNNIFDPFGLCPEGCSMHLGDSDVYKVDGWFPIPNSKGRLPGSCRSIIKIINDVKSLASHKITENTL